MARGDGKFARTAGPANASDTGHARHAAHASSPAVATVTRNPAGATNATVTATLDDQRESENPTNQETHGNLPLWAT